MKASIKFLLSMTCVVLSACSTQAVKQEPKALSAPAPEKASALADEVGQMSGQNPPMTITKGENKLNLMRIMDGAACKNALEGAKGTFLLYAEPHDIARIKREKGAKIFAGFESQIQAFSTDALQHAIDATNLSPDPFSLGKDEAQEKLAKQLAVNFRAAIAGAIDKFRQETTLTIEITAFQPSFVFYQSGCEATHTEPDNQNTGSTAP